MVVAMENTGKTTVTPCGREVSLLLPHFQLYRKFLVGNTIMGNTIKEVNNGTVCMFIKGYFLEKEG